VLLMHGLETPATGGEKGRNLRTVFGDSNVIVPDMKLREFRSVRKNPLVALAYGVVGSTVALSVGALYWAWKGRPHSSYGSAWKRWALAPAVLLVGYLTFRKLFRSIVAAMLEQSLAIQRAALVAHKPDLVVGSSWGGGVAVNLLASGDWKGPTLLLAPAQDAISRRMGVSTASYCRLPLQIPIVIVHSTADEQVPVEGSIRMANLLYTLPGGRRVTNEHIELVLVKDDDHRLNKTMITEKYQELLDKLWLQWQSLQSRRQPAE